MPVAVFVARSTDACAFALAFPPATTTPSGRGKIFCNVESSAKSRRGMSAVAVPFIVSPAIATLDARTVMSGASNSTMPL